MKHFANVKELKKELRAFLGANDYAILKRQVEKRTCWREEGFEAFLTARWVKRADIGIDEIIVCAFPWCNSRKGIDYWSNINQRWLDYLHE